MATLLDVAKVRTKTLTVGDAEVIVREVGALEFSEYGQLWKADKRKAVATLLSQCIVDESGEPIYTAEQCMVIAKSARASLPLVAATFALSGFGDASELGEPDAG